MKTYRSPLYALVLIGCALQATTGCHRNAATTTPAIAIASVPSPKKAASKPPNLTSEELKRAHPNEAGLIPILEYNHIEAGTPRQIKTNMYRSPDQFRHDLQRLYDEDYRPVSMSEYLDNRIALPYGEKAVIFTFDDAYASQFQYKPDGSIDHNCAVGILQAFHAAHSDWPLKGTFFVLPTDPGFGPRNETAKKLQALLSMGFEIGNHTIHHPILSHLSDEKVQWELATCAAKIKEMAPNAKVDTMALPFGVAPRNRALEASGESGGQRYQNRAVFLVGAGPAPSVTAKRFNSMKIPRIQAIEGNFGVNYWLDNLKTNKSNYISDGDPDVTTIPKNLEAKIDPAKLHGAQLRTY